MREPARPVVRCRCGKQASHHGLCDSCSDAAGVCRDCGEQIEQPDPGAVDWDAVARELGYHPSSETMDAVRSCVHAYRVTACELCKGSRAALDASQGGYAVPEPPTLEQRLDSAGVPRMVWAELSFEDCVLPASIRRYHLNWLTSGFGMTTITGAVGVGKSCYCGIHAMHRVDSGGSVKWIDTLRWLKETAESEKTETIIGSVARFSGLLVLDDFTPTKKETEWRAGAIFDIIKDRVNHNLETLINTTASLEEIGEVWGKPVQSRLRSGFVEWRGRDRRE